MTDKDSRPAEDKAEDTSTGESRTRSGSRPEDDVRPAEDPTPAYFAAAAQTSQFDQSSLYQGGGSIAQSLANPSEGLVAAEEAVDKANLADQKERAKASPLVREGSGGSGDTGGGVDDLTVAELKDRLDNKGIEYTSADKKADLQAKLSEAEAPKTAAVATEPAKESEAPKAAASSQMARPQASTPPRSATPSTPTKATQAKSSPATSKEEKK